MAFCIICSRVGGMLSPWVSKWLRKYSFRIPFALMGGLAVISAILLQTLPETKVRKSIEGIGRKQNEEGIKGMTQFRYEALLV